MRQTAKDILLLSLAVVMAQTATAQTVVKPGFNIFSEQQDVEIGKQSAVEVEKQMPVLNDSQIQNYVTSIGQRLAAVAPGPKFPYQFKVVNVSDVNAFALPGGFMYIFRGLMESAHDEAELAGVMAHEMSHVALRHGTNQASKAYLAQAGLGVLGGMLGGGKTTDIVGAIGGFGLNSVFLKFSRTAEEQADITGAQILAKAGYDPMAMARMFETLREQAGRDPSKLERFFSDHPAPAERAQRIEGETQLIGGYTPHSPVGDFSRIQARLGNMPKAPSAEQLAGGPTSSTGSGGGRQTPVSVNVPTPSTRLKSYNQRQGLYSVRYPDNWRVLESQNTAGVTLAPDGGIVTSGQQESIVYGVIVNTYDPEPSSNRQLSLEQATENLISQIMQGNDYLRRQQGMGRRIRIDGAAGLSAFFAGTSPVTNRTERVVLMTRAFSGDQLIYLLFIAPESYYDGLKPTFDRILSGLKVNK